MKRERFTGLHGSWQGDKFVLSEPFTYRGEKGWVTVPAGFVTDFDSVPRIPFVYWRTKGRTRLAAVVHDYLYDSQPGSRREADRVFLEAMNDEGVPRRQRWPIWLGVRIGGWNRWRKG